MTELSKKYRFRGIGGTSAGAIAAAATAAAEHGREAGGFDKLADLPERLGRDLAKLFQPSQETHAFFDAAMQWVTPDRSRLRSFVGTVWFSASPTGAGSFSASPPAPESASHWPSV